MQGLTFSLRDVFCFITFLSVVLTICVWADGAMPLVLLHGVVLSFAVLAAGSRLYRWMITGAAAVPLFLFSLMLQWEYGGDLRAWRDVVPDMLVAVCFGAAGGTVLWLDKLGKEFLRLFPLGLAMVDFLWLMLPRVH